MVARPKPLILIVEDDEALASAIQQHLEHAGMLTQVYYRTAHAQRFLQNNFSNLMLLDVTLPDQDGFTFLEELRRNEIAVPTIFLTGNDSEVSKVKGLEIGADDYVTKPFSAAELVARINAVLRRAESAGDNNVTKNVRVTDEPFAFAGAEVNPNTMTINFPNGDAEKIGRKELGILAYLNSNPKSIITRKNLIHSVWGLHADIRSRSLDQYIVKIRDIFNRKGMPLQSLRTIHGIGYEFDPEETIQEAPPVGVSENS
jgi:DNA-binding response OmpR family regulator